MGAKLPEAVRLNRGISNPLSGAATSSAAEGLGLVVPIPSWALTNDAEANKHRRKGMR